MRTALECIPCFFKQALDAARLTGATVTVEKKILRALAKEILHFDLQACPSQMGRILYKLVRKISGKNDPFKKIKQKSNQFALALYPRLKKKVEDSKDRLLTALELAIAGNIIDYGVKGSLNIACEIEKIFVKEEQVIRRESKAIFDGSTTLTINPERSRRIDGSTTLTINPKQGQRLNYPAFKQAIKEAKKILYVADNAGEVVFDRILIEELKDKKITYAVRGGPIINDALVQDAIFCGIHKLARIVSSGCDAPGTVLRLCTLGFRRIFRSAELIISKGQGNFEALAEEKGPIFFLFRAKCPVVAKYLGCKLGDVILKRVS